MTFSQEEILILFVLIFEMILFLLWLFANAPLPASDAPV